MQLASGPVKRDGDAHDREKVEGVERVAGSE
jgi:hypothetical protein